MSGLRSPRGPLPARVYWFRRGLVLVLGAVLVLGMARLVASFAGGDSATTTAAKPTSTPTSSAPSVTPTAVGSPSTSASKGTTASRSATSSAPATMTSPALSAPQGACKSGEVTVQPAPGKVVGGSRVTIPLALYTKDRSCTWTVSSRTVALKITSGNDRIWSSQDCPAAISRKAVVVRSSGEPRTVVNVVWSGRRSAADCPGGLAWAKAGDYHAIAASLGGAPFDQQFRLGLPPRPVVTKTASPKPSPTRTGAAKATRTPAG